MVGAQFVSERIINALTAESITEWSTILTNGKVTGDNVGPHDDFLDDFPYLGPPHMIRSH